MKKENWKTIKDFPNYEVSDLGKVRNKANGKILVPNTHATGYERVVLCTHGFQKNVYVHRLVAQAFIPNPDNLPEVDHQNNDKVDNRVENLRWLTKRDNLLNREWCKKPIVMCDKKTGEYLRTFKNATEAAKYLETKGIAFKSARVAICQTCQGYHQSAYNYVWYYLSNYRYINKDYSKAAKESFLLECEGTKNED